MPDQITTFNYQVYNSGISMLAQQLSSRTRASVRVETMASEREFFDQVGAADLVEKTGYAADIPIVEIPHARRAVTARDWYGRRFIDAFAKLKILNDPTNAYSQAFAGGAARRIDKTIIDAALGTAYTGKEGATAVPLPAGQKIANGGTGMTLPKLQDAVGRLKAASILMPGDEIHLFWTAKQEAEMINTTEVKSSDFNNQKVMVDGELRSFYGVNFHRIEDSETTGTMLPKVSTIRSLPMWIKSKMLLGIWKDAFGRVAWIDERESWQVMAGLSVGATRMEEKGVVQIDVVES